MPIEEALESKNSGLNDDPSVNEFSTDDYEAYQLAIENLALLKDQYVFENSGPVHAAIVMGNIFRTAKKGIKVYAGDFNGRVSDNPYYLEWLEVYLTKNLPLTVIFENEPNAKSKALSIIRKHQKDRFNNSIIIKKLQKKAPFPEHFTIADGRMFRIETSTSNFKAVCSFNNSEIVNSFEERFKGLEKDSAILS